MKNRMNCLKRLPRGSMIIDFLDAMA